MDYEKLKLKSGLEIHQQLDSNGKLFCSCPSYLRKDTPDFEIKRKLHMVPSELGEVDIAVQYESSLNKEFTYQGYNDTTCLIELDEEPPKQINQEALEIAIQISLLLNCEILQTTQIMRKTVIDGSNTSGFQRTLLLAQDGYILIGKEKIRISQVYLEEDASRLIEKDKNSTTYRLDRLGVPLVEIVTSPDIKTPEQAKETALKIGELLRACKVKRGIGTIRQDINISTKNHPRVEIKGFQDPKIFVSVVEKEIERQQQNIKTKKPLKEEVRGALPNAETEFLRPLPGGARMYPETDLPLLKIPKKLIDKLKKSLPKLKTEIKSMLKKKGLSDELINLIIPEHFDEFETLSKLNKDANLLAKMISLWRNDLSKKLNIPLEKIKETLSERVLEQILESLNDNKIEKSDIKLIMEKLSQNIPFNEAIKLDKLSHDELEEKISKIIHSKPNLRANAYMGLIMKEFQGKLDAKKAMEIINKILKS